MSEKTGQKPIRKRSIQPFTEILSEFVERPDGLYNFWQYRYVKGYSSSPYNPVWVLKGVYNKIPKWMWEPA